MFRVLMYLIVFVVVNSVDGRIFDKRKCPEVRAVPHFDLSQMLGNWYVVEYYASAEEALSYSCMKAVFTEDDHVQAEDGSIEWTPGVTMNFTYRFADDPLGENLLGNITWKIDLNEPAHWTHSEITCVALHQGALQLAAVKQEGYDTCFFTSFRLLRSRFHNITTGFDCHTFLDVKIHIKTRIFRLDDGIYNTYVLDTEYKTWMLLLHCAEQREGARYLSAFVLSRKTSLPKNVMAYLRDKLPRYDVDIQYVFPIPHEDCTDKPAKSDYTPILVEVGSNAPKKPGVSYKVALGH